MTTILDLCPPMSRVGYWHLNPPATMQAGDILKFDEKTLTYLIERDMEIIARGIIRDQFPEADEPVIVES